jgi:hypothetical protein
MPDPEKVATVVWEWVAKAGNDVKTATYILLLGKGCPTDTVRFHAQHYAEDYNSPPVRGGEFPPPALRGSW